MDQIISILLMHIATSHLTVYKQTYQWRWRRECRPSLSVISAAFIALGRSCLFANTSNTASLNSSWSDYDVKFQQWDDWSCLTVTMNFNLNSRWRSSNDSTLIPKNACLEYIKTNLVQHSMELISGFNNTISIVTVHHKYETLCILEVMPPKRANLHKNNIKPA